MKNAVLIILHFLLTILAYTSWLFVSYDIIAVVSLAHIVMLESCDGCFLSHSQFKDKKENNTTFYEWWLGLLGIKNYNRKKLKIFMRYWIPLIIVILGIISQVIFKLKPIIKGV